MKMNGETEEILKRIDITLKSGKKEISFRQKELDLDPAKQSVVDQLVNIGVIFDVYKIPLNDLAFGWESFDPPPKRVRIPNDDRGSFAVQSMVEYNAAVDKKWREDNKNKMDEAWNKVEWQLNATINESKFREIFSPERSLEKPKSYLYRGGDGEFFCGNKSLELINKQGTIYYKILLALYEKSDGSGFCSYETIDNFLTHNGEREINDIKAKVKRISNALPLLYLNTKENLKKAPDGKEIISTIDGKGLRFYNPII